MADTTTVAVTAPRCPNLIAAHMSNGKNTYAFPSGPPSGVIGATKMGKPATITPSDSTAASTRRRDESPERCPVLHTRIAGATRSAPIASPTHQVRHVSPIFCAGTRPARRRLVTPTVALIIVDSNA